MTVRVNKSAFNIREKLSELERPIGVKGNELMRAETAQDARDLVSAGRKNMVINGAMKVSQRRGSSNFDLPDSNNHYITDRFIVRDVVTTTLRCEQVSLTSSADPSGFQNALKVSCLGSDTSITGGEYARIQHYVEGLNVLSDWGIQNTDFLTLSFWVKTTAPGVYYASLEDGDAVPVYLKRYTIDQNNVWKKIELTFPPPPSGQFKTNGTNTGLRITWCLITGSNYHGSPDYWNTSGSYTMGNSDMRNFVDTAGNAFWLTGVQLEVGKNATEFEHRLYAEELALCQRYYLQFGYGSNLNKLIWTGDSTNGNTYYLPIQFPVEMRSEPVVTIQNYGNNNFSLTGPQTRRTHCRVLAQCTGTAVRNYFEFDMTADAEL